MVNIALNASRHKALACPSDIESIYTRAMGRFSDVEGERVKGRQNG